MVPEVTQEMVDYAIFMETLVHPYLPRSIILQWSHDPSAMDTRDAA